MYKNGRDKIKWVPDGVVVWAVEFKTRLKSVSNRSNEIKMGLKSFTLKLFSGHIPNIILYSSDKVANPPQFAL